MSSAIDALTTEYSRLAKEHMVFKEEGDYKRANSVHARMSKISREILSGGSEGEKALSGLLDSEEPSVRAWAATDYYSVDPARSKRVLEQLAKEGGLVGLEAGLVLDLHFKP